MPECKGKDKTYQRLLAQLVLVADEEIPGPCPQISALARLVDGRLPEGEREVLWQHLARCQPCYDRWQLLASEIAKVPKRGRVQVIAWAGGVLAVAASILLFLNIYPSGSLHFGGEPQGIGREERGDKAVVPMLSRQPEVKSASPRKKMRSVGAPAPKRQENALGEVELFAIPEGVAPDEVAVARGEEMIDFKQIMPTMLRRLKVMVAGEAFAVQTYKRDRGLIISKLADDEVEIREFGYQAQTIIVPLGKFKKVLRPLLKREFPRSTKVWLRRENGSLQGRH